MIIKSFNIIKLAVFKAFIIAGLAGCDKGSGDFHKQKEFPAVNFIFHYNVGSEPMLYNEVYTDVNGRNFTFTLSRYYISNIRLIDEYMNEVNIDAYLLVKPEKQNLFTLDTIPPGKYAGLKFDIGLDSITNYSNPSNYPEGNPLAIQKDVSMHWGSPGYYFVKLEGKVDTSVALNRLPDFKWELHLLTDELLRTVEIMRPFELKPGIDVNINLVCDFRKWLHGIDLRIDHTTNSININTLLARRVADNIPEAFHLKMAN